jgi:hypothetical protein
VWSSCGLLLGYLLGRFGQQPIKALLMLGTVGNGTAAALPAHKVGFPLAPRRVGGGFGADLRVNGRNVLGALVEHPLVVLNAPLPVAGMHHQYVTTSGQTAKIITGSTIGYAWGVTQSSIARRTSNVRADQFNEPTRPR